MKPDTYIEIGIWALGEFLPRNPDDLGIGSSFEPFYAEGPGDTYHACLWPRLQNHGLGALFIVRCVYENTNRLPVYVNALRSQKYRNAYEVKFGEQWKDMSVIIPPKGEIASYAPLSILPPQDTLSQGTRGRLPIEYVYNGRTGRHRARL